MNFNIIIATAEPKGNYHLKHFIEDDRKFLTHLVPDMVNLKQDSIIRMVDDRAILETADLIVLEGGNVSEWTRQIGFIGNELNIPVVLSEMAYNSNVPPKFTLPVFVGVSAEAEYGAENYRQYFKDKNLEVEITGSMKFDHIPNINPEHRILILDSVSMADSGDSLKKIIVDIFNHTDYKIAVRHHPRQKENFWAGYPATEVEDLVEDILLSELVVGVPGTPFTAIAALNKPVIAVEETVYPNVLPEFREIFTFSKAENVLNYVQHPERIKKLTDEEREYIAGPIGYAREHLLDFWFSYIE